MLVSFVCFPPALIRTCHEDGAVAQKCTSNKLKKSGLEFFNNKHHSQDHFFAFFALKTLLEFNISLKLLIHDNIP